MFCSEEGVSSQTSLTIEIVLVMSEQEMSFARPDSDKGLYIQPYNGWQTHGHKQ